MKVTDFPAFLDKYLKTPVKIYYIDSGDEESEDGTGLTISYRKPETVEYTPGKFETKIFINTECNIYSRSNPAIDEDEKPLSSVPDEMCVNYSLVLPQKICVRDPDRKLKLHLPVLMAWPIDYRKELLSSFIPGLKFTTLTELKYY